ncbi:MAG: diaminopimelate decarboxylase [Polynucleobacter sp. 24-46-87]|jgi:diaminopimelate decarboxylase|uniref:diaminopimelate decarboxylase n=1 Tax=Polynucleobacter sp. 39-46-10 TaxID=1970428 RepID=UPI000BDA268B|nr:diaminopimelate decarboxylase [Polynucleobacter sp. 39-46-10]OZA16182.1 MAG: diaminopimelate decarboxylase [Polynucleobacter sp. 24-46-87]OZA77255.1 MAG: diaminopimelate decarboxylase [Polynucleobacter sp. 39-46-10]
MTSKAIPLPDLAGFTERNGNWYAEEIPLSDLAKEFGTPLYVYSKKALTEAYQAYDKACVDSSGKRRARVHYAMKANSNLAVIDCFKKLGSGFDLVSGGELARALAVGADPKSLVFAGVGKSAPEIAQALEAGVKSINVESIAELHQINRVATKLNCRAPISLRVNPDVDAQTHPYISTGLKGNKFGIAYHEILKTYREAALLSQIDVVGIDCHIGSQITTTAPYLDALDKVLELVAQLKKEGIEIHHLDLGGGLGISYGDDNPPDITDFTNTLLNRVAERGFAHLDIVLEPGRSLVGNAGVLLTQVEYLKPGAEKNFCIVDAAMTELMRPALYEAYHGIVPVKTKQVASSTYDVVGPVCESGDWLGRDRELAVEEGDLLAILSAGAYGFVMASNYNTRPKPAEIMVDGKNAYVIRARENVADLFASENVLPN